MVGMGEVNALTHQSLQLLWGDKGSSWATGAVLVGQQMAKRGHSFVATTLPEKLRAGGRGLSCSLGGLGQASGSLCPQFAHSGLLPALLHHPLLLALPIQPWPASLAAGTGPRWSVLASKSALEGHQGPRSTPGRLGPARSARPLTLPLHCSLTRPVGLGAPSQEPRPRAWPQGQQSSFDSQLDIYPG